MVLAVLLRQESLTRFRLLQHASTLLRLSQPIFSLVVAMNLIAFGMPGTTELVVFMLVVLVIFGSARLPSLMRNLGRSANEFKAGMRDPVSSVKDEEEPEEKS